MSGLCWNSANNKSQIFPINIYLSRSRRLSSLICSYCQNEFPSVEDTFTRCTRDLCQARFRKITTQAWNGPVNSGYETRQCSTSCQATTGRNKYLRAHKWKLMGPVSNRPFSRSTRQSCSKRVLTSSLALIIRLNIRSTISWPVNSRTVLKVCLMRFIQHDWTWYTRSGHQSHYQALVPGQQTPVTIVAYDSTTWSILSLCCRHTFSVMSH